MICLQMASDTTAEAPKNEAIQEASYLFVKILGKGAFGEAVLYRKTDDNSLVVWKEVNLARLGEKETRDALGEVDILSLLDHPNIITYYNHFLDNQTLLIELEYANGGTLYHKIASQTDTGQLYPEDLVMWYLFQLVSAVAHIHQYGIIHRDIKTMNIFLTKSDLLKIGDFGISKVLESKSEMADTLIGTPYYMSPELVKGDKYDYKTDVWAIGCVLYELLTLERTFQATNQLRLAYEIVKGDKGEINSKYSNNMRQLVDYLLKKDPKDRPEAEEILKNKMFTENDTAAEMEKKVWELNSSTRRLRLQSTFSVDYVPVVKSKMSEVYQWGGGKVTPQKQEMFVKGKSAIQVAAGCGHFAVVTMEKELYTWANLQGGLQLAGQLGHGNNSAYKAPKLVERFEGVGIIQVSCGEDFTVCVTDDNKVYSFGSDYYGCLGVDNEFGDTVSEPVPVNYFSNIPVQEISCGDNHVAALSNNGEVFTWGCGEYGRLGLGSEDDYSTPQKVNTPGKHLIKHVIAGSDGTFLVSANGRVLAAGSNEDNKLGFNSETSGLRKSKLKVYDIPCKYTFSTVKPLTRHNIVIVAAGKTHSAVVDAYGHLYTFGCNKYGQLGLGDFRRKHGITRVAGVLSGKRIENVACGDGFTVVSTNDNQLYSWGNGENGRLGAVFSDQGKGPNHQSTGLPRAIFGSLHVVPNLSARHWHTIVIAEKVLNQKTLKTSKSATKSPEIRPWRVNLHLGVQDEDSAFISDGVGSDVSSEPVSESEGFSDSGQPLTPDTSGPQGQSRFNDSDRPSSGERPDSGDSRSTGNRPQSGDRPKSGDRPRSAGKEKMVHFEKEDTEIPIWLKAELEDADYIPMPGEDIPDVGQNLPKPSVPSMQPFLPQVMSPSPAVFDGNQQLSESKDSIIARLSAKVNELETQNKQLSEQVQLQDLKIKTLELKLKKQPTSSSS